MSSQIPVDHEKLAEFCRRHHVRKLSLFGSVLREDFRPDSDVDVLVVFEPGHPVGLRVIDMQEELSEILGGHKVDIVSEKYLNRRLRGRILTTAEVQYEEAGTDGTCPGGCARVGSSTGGTQRYGGR